MSPNFWKGLRYGFFFVALFFYLPGFYAWFVLEAPWWLVLLIALGVLWVCTLIEFRRRAR